MLGLHIHDAQLSEIFYHKPMLRHESSKIPLAASDDLFQAPTSEKWAILVREKYPDHAISPPSLESPESADLSQPSIFGTLQSSSYFRAYTVLEGIGASIWEARFTERLDTAAKNRFAESLISFYRTYRDRTPTNEKDPFSIMILWHSIFVSLSVDYNLLECVIGRESPANAAASLDTVRDWAKSIEAERCMYHVLLMERHMENSRVGAEPAIHVPRALFLSAVTAYCYSRLCPPGKTHGSRKQELHTFPEVTVLGTNLYPFFPDMSASRHGKSRAIDSSTLCHFTDHLQRVGHWEIARKFALILETLIQGDLDTHSDCRNDWSSGLKLRIPDLSNEGAYHE